MLSARGFYTVVDDAIVENVVSQDPSQSQLVNAGQSRTLGTELGLTHYTNRYFTWFTNMTYMSTNVKNSVDPNQNNSNIPFVPKWLANLGFTANLPYDIYISPYVHFVGQYFDSTDKNNRRSFGNYAEFNMKLRAGLFKTRSCSGFLNLDLNNLTNRRYEMPWQFQNTGFNFLAKLEVKNLTDSMNKQIMRPPPREAALCWSNEKQVTNLCPVRSFDYSFSGGAAFSSTAPPITVTDFRGKVLTFNQPVGRGRLSH